ncbi:hypothetical protein PGT21_011290 [Puccinia graminis f. sp. tritici]|uniref:Uncharacterized protein n=1 Tax=Puccinia graminis f. sp. tritici TaxID=56615 RepID=A0A5B0NDN0_PUCGR|nr:hypothetical protein PGT21_011290 [Puccinia graminis f. sp. tritici]
MSNPHNSHPPGRGPPTRSQPFENFTPMDRVPFGLLDDDHDQLYFELGDQPTAAYFDPNFTATQTAHSYSQPSQTILYHTQPNPALTHPNSHYSAPDQYHNPLNLQPSSLPNQTLLPSHPTIHVPSQPNSHSPFQPTSHAVSNQTLLLSNSSQAQPPASNQTLLLLNLSQAQPPAAKPFPSWVSSSSQPHPPAAMPLPSWEQLTQDAKDAHEQQQSNSARGAPGRGTA